MEGGGVEGWGKGRGCWMGSQVGLVTWVGGGGGGPVGMGGGLLLGRSWNEGGGGGGVVVGAVMERGGLL